MLAALDYFKQCLYTMLLCIVVVLTFLDFSNVLSRLICNRSRRHSASIRLPGFHTRRGPGAARQHKLSWLQFVNEVQGAAPLCRFHAVHFELVEGGVNAFRSEDDLSATEFKRSHRIGLIKQCLGWPPGDPPPIFRGFRASQDRVCRRRRWARSRRWPRCFGFRIEYSVSVMVAPPAA
jgi:hypothetical protein